MLASLALQAIDSGTRFMVHCTVFVCMLARGAVIGTMSLLWEVATTGAVWTIWPPACWVGRRLRSFKEYLKLVRLYIRHGKNSFETFAAFRRYMEGENGEQQEESDGATSEQREYERALEILGFAEGEEFSFEDLKQRYRQLLAVVHPDKGFKSSVFAQLVNEAVLRIKRERGWS
ncbi:DnaJ family molecular chaperone [Caballeronia udeis]